MSKRTFGGRIRLMFRQFSQSFAMSWNDVIELIEEFDREERRLSPMEETLCVDEEDQRKERESIAIA